MIQIGVIGAAEADEELCGVAYRTGVLIASIGAVLISGGRGGVMEAASSGASDAGGLVIGILPDSVGNSYLDIAIRTGLGNARNAILVRSSDVLIAIGGGYGTLSEIALALKEGKMVYGIKTWDIPGIIRSVTPEDAFLQVCQQLGIEPPPCAVHKI